MTALHAETRLQSPTPPTRGIVEPDAARLARLAPLYDGLYFLRAIKDG